MSLEHDHYDATEAGLVLFAEYYVLASSVNLSVLFEWLIDVHIPTCRAGDVLTHKTGRDMCTLSVHSG